MLMNKNKLDSIYRNTRFKLSKCQEKEHSSSIKSLIVPTSERRETVNKQKLLQMREFSTHHSILSV